MSPRSIPSALLVLVLLAIPASPVRGEQARILRQPTVSADRIAFVHAQDVWIVDRAGGEARRLTTFPGAETDPHFSPDGSLVAFSGVYDGNVDVYVVEVEGGEPRRLTWHPGPDLVRGWTGDGRFVLFASGRVNAPRPWPRLWTIPIEGGMPESLPLTRVARGAFSPDGRSLAYQKVEPWESEFRNYRGGQAQPIRVVELQSLEMTTLPWEGSNDLCPVWIGRTIFFLSDRDWAMNVWAYDTLSEELVQRTFFTEFDCKNLDAVDDALVFENGGYLYLLDPTGGEPRRVPVQLRADFPWARPHWENVKDLIHDVGVSPTGKRAVFAARGEILTVPAEKGDIRNLTESSGAADRAPAWSPDGEHIAWFSDAGGEYQLVIADQRGETSRTIPLENPDFYYTPAWSPDSGRLAFTDAGRVLWVVEVESGRVRRIDDEGFAHPARLIHPVWSPDSKWIAYSRRLESQYNAVFLYSVENDRAIQFTDGLANAHTPAFDAGGNYLYFLASTNYGMNVGWLDMSSFDRPTNYALYVAVLDAQTPSPLAPQSDDEEVGGEAEPAETGAAEEADGKGADEKPVTVKIDFDGVDQRILALDLPARPYSQLHAGEPGVLFYAETIPNQPGRTVHRYSLEKREAEIWIPAAEQFVVSHDGKKILYASGDGWYLVDAGSKPAPGDGALDLSGLQVKVDPSAEWEQIFRESWRFQRDFFYVPNVHGLDLDWARNAYAPWVEHVRHRADLTYLLDILGGETSIGHSFTGGGDEPDVTTVPVGLLGADYEVDAGRYRITRIFTAESWNPELRAPLSGPGLDVREGDYLLAVDGVELVAGDNLHRLFDRKADRQVRLTLGENTTNENTRDVVAVPVADETGLRQRAWVEENRRRVDELSGGRLAYVWVPDTGESGYASFNRYYFAQQDKQGVVIDERFNHGGTIADYMVHVMSRELLGYFNNPIGDRQPWTAPNAAIWGPKVMLMNEMSGSGGDMLPYMFRKMEIGPLVGTRTWGGLVGIWDVPQLIDGGYITAPRGGFFDVGGRWAVENEGVAPDVEVEQLPKLRAIGRDPQLERAVEIGLDLLETRGVELLEQPPDPVRVRRPER